MQKALVLAGGGVAGIAWELGVLRGIQDADPDLATAVLAADVVIGTSAGSVVAAQITSGTPLTDLYDRQLAPTSTEIDVQLDFADLMGRYAAATEGDAAPELIRKRIGAIALDTATVDEATRRAAIAARLPVQTWPERRLMVTAVDAESGDPVVFTPDSGVELVDAIAASCAVPGVWPTVTVNGRRLMDGGIKSVTNADLATGSDAVLILTPLPSDIATPLDSMAAEIESLGPARVFVVHGDDATMQAFGTNPLSPATRTPAAQAGRALGQRLAGEIAAIWR